MAVGDVTTKVIDGHMFRYEVEAPRTLRAHPEYEKMVWDECLKAAHAAGHVPVGSIFITDEDIPTGAESGGAQEVKPEAPKAPPSTLGPDAPMSARIADYFQRNPGGIARGIQAGFEEARRGGPVSDWPVLTPPTMRVTAEVEIGSSIAIDVAAEVEEPVLAETADFDAELRKLLDEG